MKTALFKIAKAISIIGRPTWKEVAFGCCIVLIVSVIMLYTEGFLNKLVTLQLKNMPYEKHI